MDNNTLYHHGVKGMRWGRRKSRTSSGTTMFKRSSNQSEDHVRAKALKKKKLSQMSNAELKELNNRMQLESQYKNLKKQNISTGRKFVQDVMYDSSKELTKEYTKKYAKKGIELVGMALSKK